MTEWGVVTVIIALVGLFVTVVKPLLTLNTSIVKLTSEMESVSKSLDELNDKNTENHKRSGAATFWRGWTSRKSPKACPKWPSRKSSAWYGEWKKSHRKL